MGEEIVLKRYDKILQQIRNQIKYIKELEKRIKKLNPYDSIPVRRTMENGKREGKNV